MVQPVNEGFLIATRDDAPTDAVLAYHANIDVEATIVEGPGSGTVLTYESVAPGVLHLFPPAGGWVANADYVVEVRDPEQVYSRFSLAFGVGDAPAEPPAKPQVTAAWTEQWNDLTAYASPLGVRSVTVEVAPGVADPWSGVALLSDRSDRGPPSQAAASVWAEAVTFTVLQRRDRDGAVSPEAYFIAAVSPSGVLGDAIPVPVRGPLACTTNAPPSGWLPSALAALLLPRTRRSPKGYPSHCPKRNLVN